MVLCKALITAFPIIVFFPAISTFSVLASLVSTETAFTPIPTVALTAPASDLAVVFRFEFTFKFCALCSFAFNTVVEVALFSALALVEATKPDIET